MYKRTIWQDHVEGVQEGTDLSAANLNNIEAGLMETAALAAMNAANQRYCYDMAKNAEVTTIFSTVKAGYFAYIDIPESATRNNTNYQVAVEFAKISTDIMNPVSVEISSKGVDKFGVLLYASDELNNGIDESVDVYFHISGGMI